MAKRKGIEVYSARDLRIKSSELIRDSAGGRLSLLTKWGKPTALAIPFDHRLIDLGVDKDLALHLFERDIVTLAKAAKIADMTVDRFMDLLAELGSPAVDYPPEELDEELKVEI